MSKTLPFKPDPAQMALWPKASGNQINGLGERDFRQPHHVYWSDPENSVFGDVQKWFYTKNDTPELNAGRVARRKVEAVPLAPLASTAIEQSSEKWSDALKAEAERLGADQVGIAKMNPDWVFEGWDVPYKYILVMAIAMDYEKMTAAPEPSAGVEVVHQYTRGMHISKQLASWLRQQGHDAKPEHGPFADCMVLTPPALAAGLGELGKHGSIINRELGSCFRLAAILTNLPLISDNPDDFGAEEFCVSCQVCIKNCPPDAIMSEKQTVRGVEKFYVDFDKCLPFFNEHAGCAICVTVCPFSRPEIGGNLVAKLAKRRTA